MLAVKEKSITPNDLDFVNYWLLNSHNATKAYQRVHPNASDETAKVNACRILTKANVKAEISRQQVELIKITGYSKEQAHQDLMDDRQLARDQKQPSAAISADSQLIRLYGMDQNTVSAAGLTINVTTDRKTVNSKEIENEV